MMESPRLLVIACAILTACSHGSAAPSGRLVSIGSHSLEIRETGEGAPVVVIDSGLGDDLEKLRPLQDAIGSVTRVVTYNRAGYGRSEPGPLPRDCGREAEELKALLDSASVPGPYILVGHSLGALNVQVFASRYPNSVAGLILLDPPPRPFILGREFGDLRTMAERMTAEWQTIADSSADSTDPAERARAGFFRMLASEHREMFGATARLIEGISTFGDLPLVVVASGKPNPAFGEAAGKFQHFWIEQSRGLAGLSSRGRFELAEGATHSALVDEQELVKKSVLSMVRQARAK